MLQHTDTRSQHAQRAFHIRSFMLKHTTIYVQKTYS